MRYYGMSNQGGSAPLSSAEEKQPVSPITFTPTTYPQMPAQAQNSESREFNRPQNQTGIYKGQIAQNVNEVIPRPQNEAPYENFSNPTIYQYPAGQNPSKTDLKCETKTNFNDHLCMHLGDYLYVELLNGTEKSGMLASVGENFVTLRDGSNHIMCPLQSINSMSIYNYNK